MALVQGGLTAAWWRQTVTFGVTGNSSGAAVLLSADAELDNSAGGGVCNGAGARLAGVEADRDDGAGGDLNAEACAPVVLCRRARRMTVKI
jgi:hypothetical protein